MRIGISGIVLFVVGVWVALTYPAVGQQILAYAQEAVVWVRTMLEGAAR